MSKRSQGARDGTHTPEIVILGLIAVLVLGALVLGGGKGAAHRSAASAKTVSAAHIALVERRVEALRGLRFRHPVPVAIVSPAQARAIGLAEDRRVETPAQRHVHEELLKLIGLLGPHDDLERIGATVLSEQVAGFYDPHTKKLALVRGAGVDDITLAHELTHALEDQHFGIERLDSGGDDDAATAGQALVEGSATELMLLYAMRYPDSAPSAGDALGALGKTASATPLPPALTRSLLFPYEAGRAFVASLLLRGGHDWSLVNNAERFRPPMSSAEILHARRWVLVQRPAAVHAVPVAGRLRFPWRRLLHSTVGEQDTIELLHDTLGAGGAAAVASGWRGGTMELWRRGPLPDPACSAPCRGDDLLSIAWRTSGRAATARLVRALSRWAARSIAHRPPSAAFSHGAVSSDGTEVRLVLAPTRRLAAALAAI